MRYSQLFGKTVRDAPSEAKLSSHKLLYQAGYIRDLVAGRYYLLPLGERVSEKIKAIIKEEMDKIGGQQMISPTLHPVELWQKTNRTASMGPTLMHLKDRREAEFVLGATGEEVFVDIVKRFNLSEKDLPILLYQFSNKFRDELRARGGLIRVREFLMKDAYSFNESPESLDKTYIEVFEAYKRIFARLGIPTVPVEADSGAIGGKVSHEFMFETPNGEDTFVKCKNCDYVANSEKAEFMRDKINLDEEMKPYGIIDQPEWVMTMDDNVKHYGFPKSRYLKNVVYKNEKGEIIIGVLRGDLEVSEVKLAKASGSAGLEAATDADLEKMGTKSGWVHSWGHKNVRYLGDLSLETVHNFVGGLKEKTTDSHNVNYGRDFTCEKVCDIALTYEGAKCPRCNDGKLEIHRGIEAGHVFRLDYFYSEPMDAGFTAKDGSKKKYLMGCYGIGIERAIGIIAEANNDERGLVWPDSVSPFKAHLVLIGGGDVEIKKRADELYSELTKKGVDVLYDDREDVSPGVKLGDADLIGVPYRLIVSAKTGDKIEVKRRNEKETKLVTVPELVELLH